MNKPTKPISSPGRTTTTTTEKFPPPLMRFLRSNVGNKSRRRSRASPMFVRKKNTLIETTQEPSSPKVTCIGQVRVSRSKKKTHKTTTATATATATNHNHHHRNRLCRCLRTIKPFSCTNVWSKWVTLFRCWKCGNSRTNTKNAPHQQEENHQKGEEQKQELVSFFRCCGSYKNSRKHRQHQQKQHPHQQEQHQQQEENLQEEEEQKQELVSFFRCGSYKNSGKHIQHQQKQHVEQHQGENHQEGEEQKQELISFFRSYKNSGKIKQEHQKEPEVDVQHVTSTEVDNINESLISRTPPKNAFLLTRCRSAPYRSSSLANIFRESMMEKSDEEVEDTMKELKIEKEDEDDDEEEEDEGTCNEGDGCEELKEVPLILGRCKSEPARTWDQLLRV